MSPTFLLHILDGHVLAENSKNQNLWTLCPVFQQGQVVIAIKAYFLHKSLISAMLDAHNTTDPIQKIALGNVVFGQT